MAGGALIMAKLDPDILGTRSEWELARLVEDLVVQEEGYELYANGDIIVNYYAHTYILRDVARMLPLAALVIFTILYFCFRSHWGIVIPLLAVLVSPHLVFGAHRPVGISVDNGLHHHPGNPGIHGQRQWDPYP